MKITKAIIPVAGFGTRFLPQTKAMPKEMLPIVDKPIIQIIVEELVKSGINQIILVTGWHKRAIEDHFDSHPELEALLAETGKHEILENVKRINSLAEFIYVRQKGPLGNATPISNALTITQDEPFIVCWGDEFILSDPPMATQLIQAHKKYGGIILGAINTTNPKDGARYGFAKGKQIEDGVIEIEEIVEKPGIGKAPSPLATVAGFLFTAELGKYLKQAVKEVQGHEPNYIDALNLYMKDTGKKVYAMEFKNSTYYDTGSKLGYLQAVIEFGLMHPETREGLQAFLSHKFGK